MFKYNLSQMYRQNQRLLKNGSQCSLNPQIQRLFSSQNNQYNEQTNNNTKKNMHKQIMFATVATGLIVGYNLPRKSSEAEDKEQHQNQQQKQQQSKPFSLLNKSLFSSGKKEDEKQQESLKSEEGQVFSNVFKKTLDQFEIPKLLAEREKQKQQEYEEREETEISGLDKPLNQEEYEAMQNLDSSFGLKNRFSDLTPDQRVELERNQYVVDPFAQREEMKMKHQEYRTIKIGPHDLLKNGQMVQVSVSDPFNENVFHPTDKIIVLKHNDHYFATGSFCGFDYTNLATGAFLGEKLICPTCGSNYNVTNGFVDHGPSIRNISSFLIQNRDEQIQVVIPEHVPAFSLKEHLKKSIIDPRTYVVLGDSETALQAIDALRASFTGRIICIPCSNYGSFENVDVLNRSFTPLQKNQLYYVEKDFMDRANVEILKGEVSQINFNNHSIVVKGQKKPIEFDKILVAWGSYKKRLNSENQVQYSNVYYLEDRYSHAKCHNEILKAKSILVMGGTFEAYQTAASIREYLDSIGYTQTEIYLMDSQISEVQQAFGSAISKKIHELLKKQRISVLMDVEIQRISGIEKLDTVYFKKKDSPENEKNVEYFIRPDLVIAENGVGAPKMDLAALLTPDVHAESNEPPLQIAIDNKGLPSSDVKFSLHYNDIHSPIFAAGSATSYPSFLQKHKIRTNDVKYNIESGFFAAMNMLDKRVEFRYIPMTSMKIGETPIYFVGERNQGFHEIIINGDIENNKYVVFFVYGKEVTGFVTVGYQNLHLYLWEAMKLLIMPTAGQLRNRTLDYKDIVKAVLRSRPYIKCRRHEIIGIPSITLAETEQELDRSTDFSRKIKQNIANENEIQKQKFKELKQKYDREGVEFIEDEMDMLDEKSQSQDQQQKNRALTRRGRFKPGEESSGNQLKTQKLNMGDTDKNPFSLFLNIAKGNFKD